MLKDILNNFNDTNNVKRVANLCDSDFIKPFLQWVGGKREMIPQYQEYLPKSFKKYYEPFVGGGAMFFYLNPKCGIIGDNNMELVKTYQGVRDFPEEVINLLKKLRAKHSKELYSEIRSLDRKINIFNDLNDAEIAARFIYLNQTCFNGIYRVNKKGQFNVPIGSSLNRLICDERTILSDSKVLKNASIINADFEEITKDAENGDFVYFDPPYFPVSVYSDFTRYTKEKFYKEDHIRLKENVDKLTKKGCRVMISNSDCDFINNLYSEYKKIKVSSNRTLNCKKDGRGKVSELLIINY